MRDSGIGLGDGEDDDEHESTSIGGSGGIVSMAEDGQVFLDCQSYQSILISYQMNSSLNHELELKRVNVSLRFSFSF